MPTTPFDWSHRQKLRRALEHLGALYTTVQKWRETDPCAVTADCEVKTGKHIFRVYVRYQPTDPSIPLLIGDCIHCLRQALDHLAYKLAIVVAGTDPPPNEATTEFPIMGGDIHQLKSELPKKIGPHQQMPPGMFAALEGLQPYHGGDLELLSVLHLLDNLDKHRFPPIVAGVVANLATHIGSLAVQSLTGPRGGPLEDGAPILEFIPMPNTDVDVRFNPSCQIAFDKTSTVAAGQLVIPLLNAIRELIRQRVFPDLEAFL